MVCVALYLYGRGRNEERRELSFNAALALTYLTLPTITTLFFGMIPCDVFDNGNRYLRTDYNINCSNEEDGGDGGGLFASLSNRFDRFKEARIQKYYDEQYEKKPSLQIRDTLGQPPPLPPREGREQGVEMRNI